MRAFKKAVKHRYDDECQERRTHEPANYYNRQRTLDLRSRTCGEEKRRQAQRRHGGGHHHGAKAQHRAFKNSFALLDTRVAQVADV